MKIVCTDPKKGDIEYTVSPMVLTPENLNMFWEKSSKHTTLFNEEIRNDFSKFLEVFISADSSGKISSRGLFWRIDTDEEEMVGVLYLNKITPEVEALAHFSFFDKRTRGRSDLVKKMIKYVFEAYDFNRLSVEIPVYAVLPVFKFVESLGFVKEGKKRRAAFFDNKFFDVVLYGILKDEVLNGN